MLLQCILGQERDSVFNRKGQIAWWMGLISPNDSPMIRHKALLSEKIILGAINHKTVAKCDNSKLAQVRPKSGFFWNFSRTKNLTFTQKSIQVFTLRKQRKKFLLLTVYLEIFPLHGNSLFSVSCFRKNEFSQIVKGHICRKIDFRIVTKLT